MVCALLALATLAAYWQVGGFEFTNYDDENYVSKNPTVLAGLTLAGFRWAFTTADAANWHPVTWLSHMLDCQLFGANAGAHHMVNVMWHIAGAVVLFLALRRLTGAVWRSAMVAGLFALHPLHVESVAWVAERKDVLSGLFWMLALWAYARYAEQPGARRYWPVVAFFALGLMAKPMVVTLPFVLLLLDVWPLRRVRLFAVVGQASSLPVPAASLPPETRGTDAPLTGRQEARPTCAVASVASAGKLLLEKLPLLALSVMASVAAFLTQQKGEAVQSVEAFPLSARIANALVAYARYLGKTFWPEGLCVQYPHPGAWPVGTVVAAAAVLLAVSALAVATARRRPYVLMGWLWFLGTLVPVIGLVQIGFMAMADRYTYIPLIGVFIALTWGAGDLMADWARRRPGLVTAAAGMVLVACVVLTWLQARHWRSSVTLWTRAIAVVPGNGNAYFNLGDALARLGKVDEPMALYRRAIELKPDCYAAHNNLGLALCTRGDFAAGTNHYALALRHKPDYEPAHFNYGLALVQLGRAGEAIAHYQAALSKAPQNPEMLTCLGNAFAALDRMDEAIAGLTEAVRIAPGYVEGHHYLGVALTRRGRYDQALAHLAAALRLRPGMPDTHAQLGLAFAAQQKTREAIAQYRAALQFQPEHVEALNNLAWLLATHRDAAVRDGIEAVQLARRACEATAFKAAALVGTLAAAHAEAGQFTEAVAAAKQAISLATAAGQTELATTNQELLQSYQAGQPHRDGP